MAVSVLAQNNLSWNARESRLTNSARGASVRLRRFLRPASPVLFWLTLVMGVQMMVGWVASTVVQGGLKVLSLALVLAL